jgi:putative ABC transport system substrate-binding protein
MDRRRFLLTSLAGTVIPPLAARAQQAAKVYRIGVMFVGSAGPHVYLDAFRHGLRELGWTEGKNIELEVRAADGKYERLPAIAAELVRLKVDVIFAPNSPTVVAAKDATTSIHIVMAAVDNPVGRGFVGSLSRPGGNITGLTMQEQDILGKQLKFLKEVVPTVSRVSVLQTQVETAKGLGDDAEAGGLMAHGTNYVYNYRHAAVYVDKVLKGVKAADLPVRTADQIRVRHQPQDR